MKIVGCLPVPWPPREPNEPQPGEEALESDFDWSVCTHPELYRMATAGVDAETADEVARRWAHLGGRLQEIGDGLRSALEKASEGWRGGGVEEARGKVDQLSHWTAQTSRDSHGVANAVRAQANLAKWAKDAMPEPPTQGWPPLPWPTPQPVPQPVPPLDALGGGAPPPTRGGDGFGSTVEVLGEGPDRSGGDASSLGDRPAATSGGSGGSGRSGGSGGSSSGGGGGGGFGEAGLLPGDPDAVRERQRELHRRAARSCRPTSSNRATSSAACPSSGCRARTSSRTIRGSRWIRTRVRRRTPTPGPRAPVRRTAPGSAR
ncbi:hypothetical protein BJF85_07830 [Saccharomonospora sp. CUA-673]|uniref:PPE domain-containing protein n=1 Tax=Saccharomonospora sp. CUA-673 TaxID=1904969 RepID=UPI00095B9DC1|nr:PPE domain-containing protein [Saccharomonospora sp. CUA-673]OLT39102.1 hypothetical protein BJF85_07830 [Saccharomonospora sp. CUA-673]